MLRDFLFHDDMISVLEYLMDIPQQDFTKADIMRKANINFTYLPKIILKLKEYKIIKESRKISTATLYNLNKESPLFKVLKKLDFDIIKESKERSTVFIL